MQVLTTNESGVSNVQTLGDSLDFFARTSPLKTALVAPRYALETSYQSLSFKELKDLADSYAFALKERGIKAGQIVLLMLPPGTEFCALWFALSKLGAIVMLIDPGMGRKNLFKCIEQIGPEALISVPLVHYLKKIVKKPFKTVNLSFVTRSAPFLRNEIPLSTLRSKSKEDFLNQQASSDEIATIAFTTGSTGVPKGVVYTQKTVSGQLAMIRDAFFLKESDVSFPAFLPFAIFSLALGHKTVMPSYDPRKPASVDEKKIYKLLEEHKPTYSFGSPAFWGRMGSWSSEENLKIPGLEKVIMFGAPVSERVLKNLKDSFSKKEALSFTPYGATEALPLTSIDSEEILSETILKTKSGHGVCVGKALPGIELKIIRITEDVIENFSQCEELERGEVGEVVVAGDVVTESYYNRLDQTQLAKISDGKTIWHRMGDLAYLDKEGRVWFCGRKSHRVITEHATLYTVPVEAVFNEHKDVFKSALVGVGKKGKQKAVLCLELCEDKQPDEIDRIEKELYLIASTFPHTREIRDFLFKKKLPVDFRHNAKIIREELARWASKKLG